MAQESKFDELAEVLFNGENPISDIKTMPGTDKDISREDVATELLASMARVGILKDGKVVDTP